ncbi:MAG: RNA polymerase sigma factor [Prevotella sp.]|jgi:RNA polymerase sigma factor (sigma-70 family)
MVITAEMLRDFRVGQIDGFFVEVYPSLLSFVLGILGDEQSMLGEDCVQEAIFKSYAIRSSFNTPQQLKSYLYHVAHNNAINLLRKQQSQRNYLSQSFDVSEDLSNAIIRQETLDMLSEAIESLPESLSQIFHLSFEEGLKNAEVATRLGISESLVKKRKAKMIAELRNRMGVSPAVLMMIMVRMGMPFS